jgi:LPXTG-motif cell wall-anchored protein
VGPLWQINSASYQAELTCPDLEQEPEPGLLPATGPASAALIGAAGFVLAGVGTVLVARPRRTPAH